MKRSKSLNSLPVAVIDMRLYKRGGSEGEEAKSLVDDSGFQASDGLSSLEKKVDKLSEMCMEQSRVLSELTEQVRSTRSAPALDHEQLFDILGELLQKLVHERETSQEVEGGAQSLLSAIEARPSLERRICAAVADLLQSEDLKQSIVSATTESMRELIRSLFSVEVSSLYVPIMERAHRQLLKHVTKLVATAFSDLEESTASTAKALHQTSQSLEQALERHQTLLQEASVDTERVLEVVTSTTEKVIARELGHWRKEFSSTLTLVDECVSGPASPDQSACASPEGAANSNSSSPGASFTAPPLTAVDRMMLTAEINKLIKEGDLRAAFTKALLAMDLSLVVTACRAAAPALLDARGALTQAILLSLMQQLATDMLMETELKCSYIEYALQNLNRRDRVTRAHLPYLIGELNTHLVTFCRNYPHHALFHRISKIIVTARNLL